MIQRPPGVGAFQFVVLATLRAAQLIRGCRPRVDGGHKAIVTAQFEIAEGKVTQLFNAPAAVGESTGHGDALFEDAPIIVQRT
jgi:RNA polymerase Rpb6